MFTLAELRVPIIVAPMAGGVSTPELVAAAESAGGLGFLAGGYRPVADLLAAVERTRSLGGRRFGVNLFVPEARTPDLAASERYRDALAPLAERFGIAALPRPRPDDDAWSAKVDAIVDARVSVVSFAFGCPDAEVVRRFHDAGTAVVVTVTRPAESLLAAGAGADALVVQGPAAGGHRSVFDSQAPADETPLGELLRQVRAVTALPLVAAGGLTTGAGVREALRLADAVQLGTAFLDADESGTPPAHRRALRDPAFTETVVTRAFTGRLARGLRNAFADRYGYLAPAEYPAVNQVTGPIRRAAAAAGDVQHTHLWAGTGWRDAQSGLAGQIIESLWAAAHPAAGVRD